MQKALQQFDEEMEPIIRQIKQNNPDEKIKIQEVYDNIFNLEVIKNTINKLKNDIINNRLNLKINDTSEEYHIFKRAKIILTDPAYVKAAKTFFKDPAVKSYIKYKMNDSSVKKEFNDCMSNPETMRNITKLFERIIKGYDLSELISAYYDEIDNFRSIYLDDIIKNSSDSNVNTQYQELLDLLKKFDPATEYFSIIIIVCLVVANIVGAGAAYIVHKKSKAQ